MISAQTASLVRKAHLVVAGARARKALFRAWDLLQERDADGQPRGSRPWTEEALAELESAYSFNPDNLAVRHHLAIAQHSRAWDLELAGDPRAAAEWPAALGHWHALIASGAFWEGLIGRVKTCLPHADTGWVAAFRQEAPERLLDVHVEFVRRYAMDKAFDRARAHVTLIRRAQLPLQVKHRMVEKVFEAMTSAVAEALATHAYDSALTPVERFLEIFPDHLTALRVAVEICGRWGGRLSWEDQWAEITVLSEKSARFADALESRLSSGSDPLALPALKELTLHLASRGHDRARSLHDQPRTASNQRKTREAYRFAIDWFRRHSPMTDNAIHRQWHLVAASDYAALLRIEAMEVAGDIATPEKLKLETLNGLLTIAIKALEEAISYNPRDESSAEFLAKLREEASMIHGKMNFFD